MPLAFAFTVLAVGVMMITAGVADPEGGPLGMLRELVQGKAPVMRNKKGDVLDYMPALFTPGTGTGGGGVQTAGAAGGGIVGAARAQIGKPYSWGGVGPNSWDCSGLTWHAAKVGGGLAWPRLTAEGQRATTKYNLTTIAASTAGAGDLIFFGIPASHCGVYLGGGRMIHAPSTGDVVKEGPITGHVGPITYRRVAKPAPVMRA